MKLENLGITELSRLLGKSRPTVYKYVTDYKSRRFDSIPNSVKELFDHIESGCAKSDIYAYCENNFFEGKAKSDDVKEISELIAANERNLDLKKLKNFILGEIENGKRTDD